MDLSNKSVAIVGVGDMGEEIAYRLAEEGIGTFFLADRDERKCLNAAIRISERKFGGTIHTCELDVTNIASWSAWLRQVEKVKMPIDIFIYTAGMIGPEGKSKFIAKWSIEEIVQVFLVNEIAAIGLINEFLNRFFIPQKNGHIITIASMAGMDPQGGSEIYDCTKAGLIGYMRALSQTLAGSQKRGLTITCNSVAPGMVHTTMIRHLLEEGKVDSQLERFGQTELSEPSDIAQRVYELLRNGDHGRIIDHNGNDLY